MTEGRRKENIIAHCSNTRWLLLPHSPTALSGSNRPTTQLPLPCFTPLEGAPSPQKRFPSPPGVVWNNHWPGHSPSWLLENTTLSWPEPEQRNNCIQQHRQETNQLEISIPEKNFVPWGVWWANGLWAKTVTLWQRRPVKFWAILAK